MKKLKLIFLALMLTSPLISAAQDIQDSADNIAAIKVNLGAILPANVSIESIEKTAMENVYIASVQGEDMYVYSAGNYVMVGDVYDATRRVSLGEERKGERIVAALTDIPQSEYILMSEPAQRHITVFTDTDCFYCQKFHKTVPELTAMGIQVRYLMFPRAGLNSESYKEAVSVWCSEDQADAMTIAKSGGVVDEATCENPVAAQYKLGQKMGIRGTPTMILDSGKVIPGFLTPEQIMVAADIQ